MIENRILKAWSEKRAVLNAWLQNPSTLSAETLGDVGYDCLTIDLQHGMIDYQMACYMMQAVSYKPVTPIVRVPSHEPSLMMKLLDAGALGLICPFVNNRTECEAFVSACRYPPRGTRSNGVNRAMLYAGKDYPQHADSSIVNLAMIETGEGVKNVDEILSVDGLHGIFIGPTDLAFSLGRRPNLDVWDDEVARAIDTVIAAVKKAGKHIGTVSSTGDYARKLIDRGFDFVTPGIELNMLKTAAEAEIARVKGGK